MLEIHKNIRNRRLELGMSQQELAIKTGYTDRSSIAKIEAGRVDLSQSKILAFASALNTTASELMGEEPSPSIYYDKQIFASNLTTFMRKHNESQVDIAKLLDVSKSTISAYCKGTQMPRMDKVEILAQHYGVLKSDLLEDKNSVETASNNDTLIDSFTYAMQNESKDLTEADKQLLISMARQLSKARTQKDEQSD